MHRPRHRASDIIAGIATILEGANDGLDEYLQSKSEYYQYYYDQADVGDYYQP